MTSTVASLVKRGPGDRKCDVCGKCWPPCQKCGRHTPKVVSQETADQWASDCALLGAEARKRISDDIEVV